MKKKILSLILVAAMLASMLVVAPVSGATESDAKATWEVTDAAGFAGDTISVDVIITMHEEGKTRMAGAVGCFEYDMSRLVLIDRVRGEDFTNGGEFAGGQDGGETCGPFTNDGSHFSVYAGGGSGDAAEGYVAFTLTFQIKEDAPAGDAFIKFDYRSTRASYAAYSATGFYDQPGDIEWIDGKVTVLDGYAPVTNPADFEISESGEGTCTIVEYLGDASVLNIPSEINGLTVTAIGPMIFCEVDHETYKVSSNNVVKENNTVRTIVVPATVTTIAEWAFMNANVCENVIILGDALESVSGSAFGFVGGTWGTSGNKKFKFQEDAWPMGVEWDDEAEDWVYNDDGSMNVGNVKLTLVNADSLGEGFEAEIDVAQEGYGLVFTKKLLGAVKTADLALTIGEETVNYAAFGATIKAPTIDGVVAWTDAEGNVYAPGADLGDATEITAVIVDAPVSDADVTAKINKEFAMRFQATVSKATYDAMAALGEGEVQMGMLITPRQYVVMAGNAFTKEALDAFVAAKIAEGKAPAGTKGYVDVPVQNPISANAATFEECTEFTIAGSLAGLKESTAQKNPDFVAIGYLQVALASGDVVTVYGEYNYLAANNVGDFLTTLNDTKAETEGWGNTQKGWINTWKGLFGQTLLTVDEE